MEIITRDQALAELKVLEDLNTKKLKNDEKYSILENMGFEYREIGTSQNISFASSTVKILNVNSRKYLESGEYLIYFVCSLRLGSKGTLRRGYVKKIEN